MLLVEWSDVHIEGQWTSLLIQNKSPNWTNSLTFSKKNYYSLLFGCLRRTQLGMDPSDPTFEKYKAKIKQKLKDRAEELKKQERQQPGQALFLLGQRAYGAGNYRRAMELFTEAVGESGPFNKLGGEIQLWLALSYQALGREEDCISLYRQLEGSHPMPLIRKQAADLRFIMEAPKLEISEDERVKVRARGRDRKRRSDFYDGPCRIQLFLCDSSTWSSLLCTRECSPAVDPGAGGPGAES